MEWYQIITTIIIPVLSVIGAGGIVSQVLKRRWERQDKAEDKAEAAAEEEQKKNRQEEVRQVFKEEIVPFNESLSEKIDAVGKEVQDLRITLDERSDKINKLIEADKRHSSALQSVLRDRLYQLARWCAKKGFTTQAERDNFESMYNNYHSLGENGVMDVVRQKFLALQFEEEHEAENKKRDP